MKNATLEKTLKELNASLNKQTMVLHSGHEQVQFVVEVLPTTEQMKERKHEKAVKTIKAVLKGIPGFCFYTFGLTLAVLSLELGFNTTLQAAFFKALGV